MPFPGSRGRSNDEVMGTARGALSPDVRQQDSMGLGHLDVIRLNRDGLENRGDEALALVSSASLRQLNANLQLRHGDRRNSNIVTVADRFVQRIAPTLSVNQNRRVED